MCQFSSKRDKFDFFGLYLAKNWFLVWNSENKCWNKNQHPRDTMSVNFQTKTDNFDSFGPNLPKMDFRIEIQKTKVGLTISFLKIPCVPIFRQNGPLWLFCPKFPQTWILETEYQITNVGKRISILAIPCVPIYRQNRQLCLFGTKFAQNWILENWNQHLQVTM